ncbi:MFS transporter [Chitinophaga filiformis]|uniref:MFS transporter, YNFM family, putative membrane transport protein n=1 Tax=Chitinophaga filiformis TaxID=104663 RepID=A0A1G7LH78_CHIFI|nr:MFS transporter [Chitinophaga filiformis]SDF48793.1 MFS transporter, YNFM family, putative membrane transport protein [Chitinophaga filiformis]
MAVTTTASSSIIKAERGSLRFRRIKNSIFLSGLSVFAQLYLFQPVLPLLCKEFKISPAESSWAVSASTMGMAVGLFIFSLKADALPRKQLMGFAMLASAVLTLLSVFIHNFHLLIAVSFVKGAILSGVTAVALAYLSEEVSFNALGLAISLYLSGNAIGGMAGRIVVMLIAGWLNWRWAAGFIGISSLILGLFFMKRLPASKHFIPLPVNIGQKWQHMGVFFRQPVIVFIYLAAFLLMGGFVSIYNYTGFHLEEAPFSLPHYVIACIFLMYTVGVWGTMVAGRSSDKIAPAKLIRFFIPAIAAGLLLMLVSQLVVFICGLGIFTFSFFGTHTLASRIVSQEAKEGKSSATSLYWLFYYAGSAIIGTATGVVLTGWGWATFIFSLLLLVVAGFLLVLRAGRK